MKTTNPHTWFFAYMRNIQGNEDRDELRKALVFDFSDGKTESLTEMYALYPKYYNKMRASLSQRTPKQQADELLDKHRKRLIAAIFETLNKQGNPSPTMEYVKRVACTAAQVTKLNDISEANLKSLYRKFGEKNLSSEVQNLINMTL